MDKIKEANKDLLRTDFPEFRSGDTISVGMKITEGNRSRTQIFEGVVIARKGKRVSETFTVRKISYGVGVERIFPINSPNIAKVEVVRKGKVRRAKLYYLRDKKGKHAKVAEREFSKVKKSQDTKEVVPALAQEQEPKEESTSSE